MADMYTWLPRLSYGQAGKEVLINELFDATSPSALFGRNSYTSAGLQFGIYGGRFGGGYIASNVLLELPNNSTTYISFHVGDGAFNLEPDGFKEGEIPLYKVITDGGLVIDYEDHRSIYGVGVLEAPTDGKQYARKDAGWAEVAASGAGDMETATYDPQGIEDDAFDRANHTGTQLMASISDKQGKVFTDPIILSDITDLDGVVDEGLYFCDLSCGVYSGSEVRVYEIVDSVIGLARLQAVSGPGGTTQSRVYLAAAWQPFGTSVTDQQVANWYNATTAVAANAVINSDGTLSRSTFDVVAALAEKLDADQVGVANGVASLGADGKVPAAQLPDLSITDTFVVADQVAMLALTAQRGDVAVRSDLNRSFILASEPASTLANWQELLTPTDAVLSVAGKTGAVTLVRGDVGLGNVDNTSDLNKPVSTATQTALDSKVGRVIVLAAVTTSSKTFAPADDMTLTPFTATGAKTASFNSSNNFAQNQVFKIGNRSATGDVTITTTGITLTGSATIPPGGTVDVKMTSATTADVILYGPGDWNTLANKPVVIASGASASSARSAIGLGSASVYDYHNIGVNLLADDGRFDGGISNGTLNVSDANFARGHFGAYNGSTATSAGRFIFDNSTFGGGNSALTSTVADLVNMIGLTGFDARRMPEFMVCEITAGAGTSTPTTSPEGTMYLAHAAPLHSNVKQITFGCYVRAVGGNISLYSIQTSLTIAKNGVSQSNNLYIEASSGWVFILATCTMSAGLTAAPPIGFYAKAGTKIQIAMPAVFVGTLPQSTTWTSPRITRIRNA